MSMGLCRHCEEDVSEHAPLCPDFGAPYPTDTYKANQAWRAIQGSSFGRLTGSTFVGLLLWSLIPLFLWFLGVGLFSAMMSGGVG